MLVIEILLLGDVLPLIIWFHGRAKSMVRVLLLGLLGAGY